MNRRFVNFASLPFSTGASVCVSVCVCVCVCVYMFLYMCVYVSRLKNSRDTRDTLSTVARAQSLENDEDSGRRGLWKKKKTKVRVSRKCKWDRIPLIRIRFKTAVISLL